MAPMVDRVSAARGIDVVGLRVDDEPELAERHHVRSVPTLIGLRDGVEVGRLVGSQSVHSIEALFSATSADGGPVVARAPRSLLATRATAGAVLLAAGLVLNAVPLVLVGAALVGWAVLGLVRR